MTIEKYKVELTWLLAMLVYLPKDGHPSQY